MQVQLLHVCVKAVHCYWRFSSTFHVLWSNSAGYSKCRIDLESFCFSSGWRLVILLVHKCKTTKMKIEVQYCQRKADKSLVNALTRSTSRSRHVCSNRSLGLESTSSVEDERLLIPQVHQRKKKEGKTTLTTAENRSEDRRCTHSPARRSIDVVDGSSSPAFEHHSTTERFWIYVFCSSGMPSTRGACGSSLETERKSAGVKKKASRDLGSALVSNGEEKRPSIEMCMMRMRHDAMSGCTG